MKLSACKTKYNYGDRLLHKYFVPGSSEPKEEILVVESISVSYGLLYSGDKKPKTYIHYECKNESGRNCSTGHSFSFIEDALCDKYLVKL